MTDQDVRTDGFPCVLPYIVETERILRFIETCASKGLHLLAGEFDANISQMILDGGYDNWKAFGPLFYADMDKYQAIVARVIQYKRWKGGLMEELKWLGIDSAAVDVSDDDSWDEDGIGM